MTEIEISVKYDGRWNSMGGDFNSYVSKDNKWEIMVVINHPSLPKSRIGECDMVNLYEPLWPRDNCLYEISFIDSKELERNNSEKQRFFYPKNNITIKDISYSEKVKQLKNQSNLMPEEIDKWRKWIKAFRQALAREEDKNSSEYKKGREFMEELEVEFNKKTGKDDNRERERERGKSRNYGSELPS